MANSNAEAGIEIHDVDPTSDENMRVVARKPNITRSTSLTERIRAGLRSITNRKYRTVAVTEKEITIASISPPLSTNNNTQLVGPINSKYTLLGCFFDINGYGDFLMMDEFKVTQLTELTMMVFLYENIMIFTMKEPNKDSYYFKDSIRMEDLQLCAIKKKTVLVVKNHTKSRRYHKEISFELHTSSEDIQFKWRIALQKCLWKQFAKVKQEKQENLV